MAIVGPPGSGKTATLVKLAIQYGISLRKSTQILSLDTFRVGAGEQLRAYAAILGVGFQALPTPLALGPALDEHRQKRMILIDTPGLGPRDLEADEWSKALAGHPEMDTHLALNASTKPSDLCAAVERYRAFGPGKLIFTRLDETSRYGAIVSESSKRGLPISFLCSGQRIPDDLEPATRRKLVDLIAGDPALALSLGAAA